MIRLDKYLSNLGLVSRRTADKIFRSTDILVNEKPATKVDQKIAYGDVITFDGVEIDVLEHIYCILYKTAGYISSDEDEGEDHLSYRHQMQDCPYVNMLHVAGRLDQDTEGLLLLSNDGQFIHQTISPKKEKEKEYEVHLEKRISDHAMKELEAGVVLDDGYKTLPAKATHLDHKKISLTITEGKFHQVKRMLEAVGNKVVYLKRIRIGDRNLDGLQPGEWKYVEK